MNILVNLGIFLAACVLIWFFAGLLLESIGRVAKRHRSNGFPLIFFTLGLLTSVSEMSVAANSLVNHTPGVAAGTLIGASMVLLLFVVPFLVITAKGLKLRKVVSRRNILLSLALVLMPAVLVLDGLVSRPEGFLILLCYVTLFYSLKAKPVVPEVVEELSEELAGKRHIAWSDYAKIMLGAAMIFIGGHYLVVSASTLAELFQVPSSLIGLLLISIGTNVPELTIALRAVRKKHNEIAFADYLGSAVANSAIFAVLPIVNGGFQVEVSEFFSTFCLMLVGVVVFYAFARSKDSFSRSEGWMLLLIYVLFVLMQAANFRFLAGTQ